MEYTLIKSKRKTVSIEVRDCKVIVRAPNNIQTKEVDRFVLQKQSWIEKTIEKQKEQKTESEKIVPLTKAELDMLYKSAIEYIPQRVEYYSKLIGVQYGKITIRCQKTRWGSCSSKKNLSFNCLIMLMPRQVADSIIVHELCHIKQMNHSSKFYKEVLSVFPDYYESKSWIKENGNNIIKRGLSHY